MQPATLVPESRSSHLSSLSLLRGCSQAIIAFCRLDGLKRELSAVRFSESPVTSLDPSAQFVGHIDDLPILLLECPGQVEDLPAVIEELSRLGIKTVIGYGHAASLTTHIPPGQVVLAESAVQTPRQLAFPYHRLLQDVRLCASRQCQSIRRARFLQVDPTEPDYLETISHRRELDAEVVHRNAMSFYVACRKYGLFALFLSVIVDSLEHDIESHQTDHVRQGMTDLHSLIRESLTQFRHHLPNCG